MPSQKLFAVVRTFFTYAPIAPGVTDAFAFGSGPSPAKLAPPRWVVTFSATLGPLPVGSEVEPVARVADVPEDAVDEEARGQDPGGEEHDPVRDRADRRRGADHQHPPGDEEHGGEAHRHQVLPAHVHHLIDAD